MRYIVLFSIALAVVLVLDFLWLGIAMKGFYDRELGELARRSGGSLSPRWPAAILVYLLIPGGIVLFVRPLLDSHGTAWQALGWGAAFGLVLYGVYDMTNLAVLEEWSLRMTLADIGWGCFLCGTTASAMRLAEGWLGR